MIYKGAKPQLEEFGPYIYREYDIFTDLKYDQDVKVPAKSDPNYSKRISDADSAKAVEATYNQVMRYEFEMEDKMDKVANVNTTLKVVNQAAMGVWYANLHADKWRFALVLIYNVVNGLGQMLAQTATYSLMQGDEFKTQPGINQYLFPTNPVSDPIAAALFTDSTYGLKDPNNWNRWQDFNPGADPQKQALLSMEFKTYFGLTHAQINELIVNWQKIYKSNLDEFFGTLIGSSEFDDFQRAGYWQWS